MKGGVTWFEAWALSPYDRDKIVKYVNKLYEIQEAAITGKHKL